MDGIKRYGVEPPPLSWMRLDSPGKINDLLCRAGYRNIHIKSKQMGYYLKNSLEWRDVLWNSGHRGLLSQLSGDDLKQFLNEHLREVDGVADDNGIWLEVEVLLATAAVRKE